MTAASPSAPGGANVARRAATIVSRPIVAALAVVALITAIRLTGTVDSDVAWQLWIGQRILAGAHLYRDILENNPPLWFWMALPADRLAAILGIRPEAVLVAAMAALVALSLAAAEPLVRRLQPSRRTFFLCYAALALCAMPWMHVGQREQIVFIAAFPYAALVSLRRQREFVPLPLAIGIGIGAALGFALKHYFLVTPILLELWLMAGLRRDWRPVRPETVAIVLAGSLYAAAVVLLERDYITNIVPLVRLAYGDFGAPSLRYLFGPYALVGLALLVFVAAHGRILASGKAPLASALLVAAVGFTAAYFLQFKGWPYHAIPLVGCASLALAALLAEVEETPWTARILAPALMVLPFGLAAKEQVQPGLPNPDLIQAVSGLGPGEPVGFLTTESAIPWSVTLQGGYRYPSRYMSFWMMGAVVRNERLGNPDPRLADLGRRIVAETVSDFTCTPPKRIIISRPRPGESGFDIRTFFLRDPRMAELLSHYRVRSRTSLETDELSSPLLPPQGPCRREI